MVYAISRENRLTLTIPCIISLVSPLPSTDYVDHQRNAKGSPHCGNLHGACRSSNLKEMRSSASRMMSEKRSSLRVHHGSRMNLPLDTSEVKSIGWYVATLDYIVIQAKWLTRMTLVERHTPSFRFDHDSDESVYESFLYPKYLKMRTRSVLRF